MGLKDMYTSNSTVDTIKEVFNNIQKELNMNEPKCTEIDALYDHLKEVYHKKNHDYGNSFEDGLNEDGLIFAKMHLMEKYNRFKMLITEKNQVNNEGIRDSLLDMANYAIMTVHWMDKHNIK